MSETRIIVCGALGRMGRRIIDVALSREDVRVVGGVEHPDCIPSRDLGDALGDHRLKGVPLLPSLEELISEGDVVIEFTGNTEATVSHVEIASLAGRASVVGTTGLTSEEREGIERLSERAPILLSPNMSLGVNLLFRLVEIATEVLRDRGFDFEVMEIHHRFKKDAPSGTAVRLGEILREAGGVRRIIHGRDGIAPREEGDAGIFALRGGDVVGDHTVYCLGFGERLELTHRATSRDTFARGAVEASVWIKGRPPGLYSMFDVLNL